MQRYARANEFARLLAIAAGLFVSSACDGGGSNSAADAALDAGADAELPIESRCVPRAATRRARPDGLRINEVVTSNDGAAVDELGETDDYVELLNVSSVAQPLADVRIADGDDHEVDLPDELLEPGQHLVLWADGETDQGPHHLPFKLAREGETVALWSPDCEVLDSVRTPELEPNETFSRFPDGSGEFQRCRYASFGKGNGDACTPPGPPELRDDVTFEPFVWSTPWPPSGSPLVIAEFAWSPASFVELANNSGGPVSLADFRLRIAAHAPGTSHPGASAGTGLPLPNAVLAPGERITVPVSQPALTAIRANAAGRGVTTVFDALGQVVERLDFAALPEGSALARSVPGPRIFSLCGNPAPDVEVACAPLADRDLPTHIPALHGPGDFAALAAGGTEVGQSAVKFVVDMQSEDAVYLLSSGEYALHYTFIREVIDAAPPLDRCDGVQSAQFNQGWYEFSVREYFRSVGRRYLLGTLVQHASGLHTIEFAVGDEISPEQMLRAFFAAAAATRDPAAWALRPADAQQLARMKTIEGQVPIVGPNAPYQKLTYQPLTRAVGYGRLRFVAAAELASTPLGPQEIVITDDVPNDIQLVGGLITEAFQTPLAHVNVLSESRGTPNMALRHARNDPRLSALRDKLVRLEVGASDFDVREASSEEAAAFYATRAPTGPRIVPTHDDTLRGAIPLAGRGILDARYLGSKAAQLAELAKVKAVRSGCPADTVPLNLPADALAVPFAHYLDHFTGSGARELLETSLVEPDFTADPQVRSRTLEQVRARMLSHPVDRAFLAQVEAAIRPLHGTGELRLRSSSNVEDLPRFNGAGLHTSSGASLAAKPETSLEDALRIVWSSLWNTRAFDEREVGHLSQIDARMGVLIHARFESEAAQGVAISRNLFDVTRSDIFYVNAQVGEATVTNPAPSVATEQLLYQWPPRTPAITYQSRSSLTDGAPVLAESEVRTLTCALGSIHDHFLPLLDPAGENRQFAMQIEWKLERGTRQLAVKQARPQPFGHVEIPDDCREL